MSLDEFLETHTSMKAGTYYLSEGVYNYLEKELQKIKGHSFAVPNQNFDDILGICYGGNDYFFRRQGKDLTEQQKSALMPLMKKSIITDREAQTIYNIVKRNDFNSTTKSFLCRPCVIFGHSFFNKHKLA